jgi:hypothetical protein
MPESDDTQKSITTRVKNNANLCKKFTVLHYRQNHAISSSNMAENSQKHKILGKNKRKVTILS